MYFSLELLLIQFLHEFAGNLFVCGIPHLLNNFIGSLRHSPQSFLAWSGFFDRWLKLRFPTSRMKLSFFHSFLAFFIISYGSNMVLVIVFMVTINELFVYCFIIFYQSRNLNFTFFVLRLRIDEF